MAFNFDRRNHESERTDGASASGGCPFLAFIGASGPKGYARRGPSRLGRKALPPGPAGLPFIGSLPNYLADPPGFLTRLARDHGDIASFRLGSRVIVQVGDPDLIQNIFNRDFTSFQKTGALLRARTILGDGLLTSDGVTHRRARRRAQPAFSATAVSGYATAVTDAAREFTARWSPGDAINMTEAMNRLALLTAGRTLFGSDLGDRAAGIARAAEDLFEYFNYLLLPFSSLAMALPFPKQRRFRRAFGHLGQAVDKLVQDRLADPGRGHDLLGRYLSGLQDENDGALDLKKIRDEVMTFLLAGHETSATALAWTWTCLAKTPAADRFYDEIQRELGQRTPTAGDLERLTFTDRVVKESMRLYSPVWNITREAMEDYRIGDAIVPAGTLFGMSPFVVHRDARFFDDPLEFRPDRWTPEEVAKRHRYTYFPFGGGPRSCIGAGFAMMEIKLILVTLAQRFRFTLRPGQRIGFKPFITLRPDGPIWMTLRKSAPIHPGTGRGPRRAESRT